MPQVKDDVALACGEGVALARSACCGCHLGLDTIFCKPVAVISRCCLLVCVLRAICEIVHIEFSACGHHQQRRCFGASHAAQCNVGIAGEELVVVLIWCRPPALVLVEDIEVRTHYVERDNRHHAVGCHRARVGGAEIGCSNERVYQFSWFLCRCCKRGKQQQQ